MTSLSVDEGRNLTICIQFEGSVKGTVDVNIISTPGTAQGRFYYEDTSYACMQA